MDLKCTKCSSENTQKLSIIVEGGTSSTSSLTYGIGGAGRNVAIGGASTSATSVTRLAEKYAAPTKVPVIRGSMAILALAWVISLFAGEVAMTIGFLLIAALMVFGWRYNWAKFDAEYADWDAKYLCLRCSNVFAPSSSEGLSLPAEPA